MTWLRLALANLGLSPLTSAVNVVLMGLGTASIVLLLLAGSQLSETLSRDARGIDLVLGAQGSPTQLVLSSVYHADIPPGNIPQREADRWAEDPRVGTAIPLSLGDSVRGFRIVGTTEAYAALYGADLAAGRFWDRPMEAVVGAAVAESTALDVESRFAGAHGLAATSHTHASRPYRVVGVLEPTGTVLDRLVLTSLESVWTLHEDDEVTALQDEHDDGDEADHDEHEHVVDDEADHDGHDHADGGDADHDGHDHADDDEADHDGHDHADGDEADHDGHDHADGDEADHDGHDHADGGDPDHDEHEHADDEGDHGEHEHADGDEAVHDGHDHADGDEADHGEHEHADDEADHDEHDHADGDEAVHDGHDHADGDEAGHDGHDHDADHARADADHEITAMLIGYRSPLAAMTLPREVNAGGVLQAASPAVEISRILQLVGIGFDGLQAFSWVLILTAALSVFAALYGSLRARRVDLAMLRCLGATRWELLSVLILEGTLLSAFGVVLGFLAGHGLMELLGGWLASARGVALTGWTWTPAETMLLIGLFAVGALAAALPAVQAYRTDVAATLAEA